MGDRAARSTVRREAWTVDSVAPPPAAARPRGRFPFPRGVRALSAPPAPSLPNANMCSYATSSSTPTPPSRSSTAPRCPRSSSAAAVELGHAALALTDHDRSAGSMEFAQAARALGLRAIHGAEVDLDDGRHLTLLVEDARGLVEPLPAPDPRARAHARRRARARPRPPPGTALDAVLEPRRGPGLPDAAARRTRRRSDEPTARRLLARFGPRALCASSSSARSSRGDRARNRAPAPRWRGGSGSPCVATGNVHAHAARARPLQDALRGGPPGQTLDASEPQRRGNRSHVLASPAAMAARFADHPDAVAETARSPSACASTSLATSATAIPGAEDAGATARARRRVCAARSTSATRRRRGRGEALRAPGGGAAGHRARSAWPASSCCTATCSSSRARWRSRSAGPDSARARCCPPARGRGLVGVLDRLLPDRPLARRPGRATSCSSGASSTRS